MSIEVHKNSDLRVGSGHRSILLNIKPAGVDISEKLTLQSEDGSPILFTYVFNVERLHLFELQAKHSGNYIIVYNGRIRSKPFTLKIIE